MEASYDIGIKVGRIRCKMRRIKSDGVDRIHVVECKRCLIEVHLSDSGLTKLHLCGLACSLIAP